MSLTGTGQLLSDGVSTLSLGASLGEIMAAGRLDLTGASFVASRAVTVNGTLALSDASFTASAGLTVGATGMVTGTGSLFTRLTNNGTILSGDLAQPGKGLSFNTVTGTGAITLGVADSKTTFVGDVAATQTVTFGAGAQTAVIASATSGFDAGIAGFDDGDALILTAVQAVRASVDGGSLKLFNDSGSVVETLKLVGSYLDRFIVSAEGTTGSRVIYDTPFKIDVGTPRTLVEQGIAPGGGNVISAGVAGATALVNVRTNADGTVPTLDLSGFTVDNVAGTASKPGVYGDFVLDLAGAFGVTYTLDNTRATTNALANGDTVRDTLSLPYVNGAFTKTVGVAFTIEGRNDAPTLRAPTPGLMVEQGAGVVGFSTSSVQLTPTDPEGRPVTYDTTGWTAATDGLTLTQARNFGTVELNTLSNVLTYRLDDTLAALNSLPGGVRLGDDVFVTVRDDQGASEIARVRFTIQGSNDAPVIVAGAQDRLLVEAGTIRVPAAPTATIQLTLTDPEGSPAQYVTTGLTAAAGTDKFLLNGTYGTAVLDTVANTLTYTLDDARAVTQALTKFQNVTDGFQITATDGTAAATSTVSFNIRGVGDPPQVFFTSFPLTTLVERGTGTAGVAVSVATFLVTDVDSPPAVPQLFTRGLLGWVDLGGGLSKLATAHGDAVLNAADNTITFTLDDARPATNALAAGAVVTDRVFVGVTNLDNYFQNDDGILSFSFSVQGTNDAPVVVPAALVATPGGTLTVRAADLIGLPGTSDPEGDALTVAEVSYAPASGVTVTRFDSPAGAFDRVEIAFAASYEGSFALGYRLSDGQPGGLSNPGTVRFLPGAPTAPVGTPGDDLLIGTGGDDSLSGLAGQDRLLGAAGDDRLNGGAGFDIAVLGGSRSATAFQFRADGSVVVTGVDGRDTLVDVELARFADGSQRALRPAGHDLEGDGAADLLWRDATSGALVEYQLNDRGSPVAAPSIGVIPTAWKVVATGDLNGDAKADIVWQNSVTGLTTAWLMDGVRVIGDIGYGDPGPDWQIRALADVNGDRTLDVIWTNAVTGAVVEFLLDGRGIPVAAPGIGTADLGLRFVAAGDLNGDGKADLVWQDGATGRVAAWLLDGAAVIGTPILLDRGADWRVEGVADLNANGTLDLLLRNRVTGETEASFLDSSGTVVGSAAVATVGSDWRVAGLSDLNADGRADIMWQNTTIPFSTIWLMDGAAVTGHLDYFAASTDWTLLR